MRRWEQQVEDAHDHHQRERQSVRRRRQFGRRQFRRRLRRRQQWHDDDQGRHHHDQEEAAHCVEAEYLGPASEGTVSAAESQDWVDDQSSTTNSASR